MNPHAPAPESAELLADLRRRLLQGAVIAVPTDTIYGLAANVWDPAAVARVYSIKGRDFTKPLPVVVGDLEQAREIAETLPPIFFDLAAAFWPGPLTLAVPASPRLPPQLTAGTASVAMRQPNLPLLLDLLRATGFPLTATSANRSGQPECRSAAAVALQLGAELDLIVDGGDSAPGALPSTLVDLDHSPPRILRPGAIPAAALAPFGIRV